MFWEEVFSTTTLCGSTLHGDSDGGANEGGEGGEGYSYDPPTSSRMTSYPLNRVRQEAGYTCTGCFRKKFQMF